jgi:hypothetical protein
MIRGWECRWGDYLEPCDVEVEHEDDRTYACAVWFEDQGNQLGDFTEEEEAELNDELTEHVNMLAREWLEEYGDYLYEQAKDRRLGL